MLHKRIAVPPHMPATAADMLLPAAAPILHQPQGVSQNAFHDLQLPLKTFASSTHAP